MRFRSLGAFAAAAIGGAVVSALVVSQTVAPSNTTVRTVVRPVTVNSGQSASNLRTTGKSVNQIYNQNSPGVVKIVSTLSASNAGRPDAVRRWRRGGPGHGLRDRRTGQHRDQRARRR